MNTKAILACTAALIMVGCGEAGQQNPAADAEHLKKRPIHAAVDRDVTLSGPHTQAGIPELFVSDVALPLTSRAELVSNLARRGKLTLSQATLSLVNTPSTILAADELTLSDAKITTGGSDLTIYVRRLNVDERSAISSFLGPAPAAAPGEPGAAGGTLRIYVLDSIEGLPRINLSGGTGGPGAKGATGSAGPEGAGGRDARNGDFGSCRRGPGAGGTGGRGGSGGKGEQGAIGGPGGVLEIYFINKPQQTGVTTYFTAPGGRGGDGGPGGAGGPGGEGGLGGRNAGNCTSESRERNRGARGPIGPIGPNGETGPVGPAGRSRLERLDIPT